MTGAIDSPLSREAARHIFPRQIFGVGGASLRAEFSAEAGSNGRGPSLPGHECGSLRVRVRVRQRVRTCGATPAPGMRREHPRLDGPAPRDLPLFIDFWERGRVTCF